MPNSIEIKDLITYMFPVMTRKYWYFSAYFALFLFIPYINILIKHLDKTKHRNLIIIITFLFCILGWFCHPFRTEPFNLNNGYSFLWLASLYIIGAYIKLYSNDFNKFKTSSFLFNYINVIGIIFIIHFIIFELTNRYVYVFMNYNSPFILIASICLFLYFSKLKNIKSSSFITNISSLSFGIYLVHEQPLIRQNFIINKFCLWANINPIIMVCNILLTSSFIFIICLLIEFSTSRIFNILHIKEFCEKISYWINKTIFKQST